MIVQLSGTYGGGGSQRSAMNLAIGLHQLGLQSEALAISAPGAYADAARARGVPVHSLDSSKGVVSRASMIPRLRAFLRRRGVRVIHTHGPGSLLAATAACRGLRPRVIVAASWHDSGSVLEERSMRGRLRARLVARALRRAGVVFGSSEDVCRRLSLASGRQARVLVNGVADAPLALDTRSDAPLVAWVGRLEANKDPLTLIRALGRLRAEGLGVRAVLAGRAIRAHEYTVMLRKEIEALGLGEAVEMPGQIDDIPGLLARSNIGVQSSRSEGLSMALLEQMMAGLAVVATEVGDTSRAIEHEATGLLVPAGDEAALAGALRRVVTDAQLRRRLGEAARDRAIREYSLTAMADRAVAAYKEAGADL